MRARRASTAGARSRSARCAACRCGAIPTRSGPCCSPTGSRGARSCASRAGRWRRAGERLNSLRSTMKLTLIKPNIGRMDAQPLCRRGAHGAAQPRRARGAHARRTSTCVMYDDRMEPIPYRRADRPGRHHGRDLHRAPLLRDRRRVPQPRRAGDHGRLPADLLSRGMRGSTRTRIFIGDAETLWATVIEDARRGALKPRYHAPPGASRRPASSPGATSTRARATCRSACCSSSRGCRFVCDFCAVTQYFDRKHYLRAIDETLQEVGATATIGCSSSSTTTSRRTARR